jgi:hypothetical protein
LLVGLIVAIALTIGLELFSSAVHSLPKDFGGTKAEMCEHVAQYPPWVWQLSPLFGQAANETKMTTSRKE